MGALLVFVDGIGYGTPGPHNPFHDAPLTVLGPLGDPHAMRFEGAVYGAIDASLGHPGLPQSATGQATIFTGHDAIALQNGHFSGHPTPTLSKLIEDESVLRRARARGKRTAFLNAYDEPRARHLERVVRGVERPSRKHPPSASSRAALAGDGSLMTMEAVAQGRAASFDLTGEMLRAFGVDAPRVSVERAAESVAAGAREVDLSLFEIWTTDMAGHAQDTTWARLEVHKLDRFLAALFRATAPGDLVVVTSDHGNLEDLGTRTHTHAKVPLLAYGAGADAFVQDARDLRDVAPRLLAHIGAAPAAHIRD